MAISFTILGIPYSIWFGFLTYACLATTVSLGIAFHVFHKDVFKYHRFFAFTTITIATIHLILGFLLWFVGILI
jgi:hypothetical protein